MTTPRLSVVMPSFNHAPFIEAAITSVLEQALPDGGIELIVIDGGSTDGSVDVIRRHGERLAYWVSEPDAGQADAINRGMQRARAPIATWLNSDDLWLPGAAARAVEAMADASVVLAYGEAICIDEAGRRLRDFDEIEPFDAWRLRNAGDFIMQPAAFFRRDAFERVGGLDPSLRYVLDWDLWIRLSAIGTVRRVPHVLAANREHDQTKTRTGGHERLDEIWRLWRRHGTSWWPHAYCSYAAKQARHDGRRLAHLFWSLAGVRNVWHAKMRGRHSSS